MPSLSTGSARTGFTAIIVAALLGTALFVLPTAGANTIGKPDVQWGWGVGEGPAGDYDFPSDDCTGNHTDPVGVLFVGKRAGVTNVQWHIELHNRWDSGIGDFPNHSLFVRAKNGGLECKEMDTANANADDASDRMHVRLWHIPASESPEVMTVGTPHHEDFVVGNGCNKHAVDPNGSVGPEHGPNASGFDWARHELQFYFSHPNSWHPSHFPQHYGGSHHVEKEYWGNSASFTQCTSATAASNGVGAIIWINHKTDPRARSASASQSSATLLGGFLGDGTTNEWWFGYGTKPAQGPSGYQKTTPVKSSSAEGAIEASAPASKLKPNTKYYARLFVRTEDNDVEEADEVAFTTQSQPLAAYSFDEAEGEVAKDLFGEHDGALEGAQWFDNGRFGSALAFDGENDCVTVADATALELSEELTLEAWVKPRSLSDLPILYKDSWGNAAYALLIGVYTYGNPEGLIGEGVEEVETVIGPEDVEEDIWTHLAFTYDGAHMRIYVNGVLVETEPQSTGPPTGEGALSIGCNHLYPENFEGLIDEVRLYDRALDAGEIATDKATPVEG